jgi:hypothetical protein
VRLIFSRFEYPWLFPEDSGQQLFKEALMPFTWKMAVVFLVILVWLTGSQAQEKAETFSPDVDALGKISLPKNYRTKWTYLGSWAVPMKGSPGQGFHDVFTQPESVAAYKKTGKFPDGAVLVKEIRKVDSGKMTTGEAYWAGDIAQWFVMVKNDKGRFKNNPNWGNGRGWALFKANDPSKNVSTNFHDDCLGCHIPAQGTDWVYIQGYPTLKK